MALLTSALLSGLAVVAVTWVAGRLGGTLGGLLATAPITTTAAMLYLGDNGALYGARSLGAALIGLPAFYAIVMLRRGAIRLRLSLGLAAFIAIFSILGWAAGQLPSWDGWLWVPVTLLLAAVLGSTFLHLPTPAAAPRRMAVGGREILLRFASGAAVIVVVDALRLVHPSLASAWAVFPGTLLVTLWVVGTDRGAGASARASQGAVLGVPPLLAYLVTVHALSGLLAHPAWSLAVQAAAWISYFGSLGLMWRLTTPPMAAALPSSV